MQAEPDQEMEITFTTGLPDVARKLLRQKEKQKVRVSVRSVARPPQANTLLGRAGVNDLGGRGHLCHGRRRPAFRRRL